MGNPFGPMWSPMNYGALDSMGNALPMVPEPAPKQPGLLSRMARGFFGGPDLSMYAGLLNPEQMEAMQKQARQDRLFATAASLLESGGPSLQKVNIGQALGRGLMAGQQAQSGYLGQQLPFAAQIQAMQAKKAQQQAVQDALANGRPQDAAAATGDVGAWLQAQPTAEKPQLVQRPDGSAVWVTPGQNLGAMGKPEDAKATADAAAKDEFDREAKLRGELLGNQSIKNFDVVRDGYAKVATAANDPSPAGDMSLVFGYMKMLDPSSSVRESEYANAQNAAGVPERIRTAWNKALSGEGLGVQQRGDFLRQAGKLYASQLEQANTIGTQYKGLSTQYGLHPEHVVQDFSIPADKLKEMESGIQAALTAYDVPPVPGQRKVNQVYNTPQGPMIWTGSGWRHQ